MSHNDHKQSPNRVLLIIERVLTVTGLFAIAIYVGAWIHARAGQHHDLTEFDRARAAIEVAQLLTEDADQGATKIEVPGLPSMPGDRPAPAPPVPPQSATSIESERAGTGDAFGLEETPDQRLWSPSAVQKWDEAKALASGSPLAVLNIPKIDLRAAVMTGTDEVTLNRGVGWIQGTSSPGTPGNVGIAGHRDSFFRGLQHVRVGDQLTLETLQGDMRYEVVELMVISPEQNSILGQSDQDLLTLVTCYPFYYVGHAPERWIVRAQRVRPADSLSTL